LGIYRSRTSNGSGDECEGKPSHEAENLRALIDHFVTT
jgi:hypothetical protein